MPTAKKQSVRIYLCGLIPIAVVVALFGGCLSDGASQDNTPAGDHDSTDLGFDDPSDVDFGDGADIPVNPGETFAEAMVAGQRALRGQRLAEARQAFERAVAKDERSSTAAAGLAITRLWGLGDEPSVRSLLSLVGTRTLSSDALLGANGFFRKWIQEQPCGWDSDWRHTNIPFIDWDLYPSDMANRIAPGVTGNAILSALDGTVPTLLAIADLLKRGASDSRLDLMIPGEMIGIPDELHIGAAEVAIVEAALRAIVGVVEVMKGYDWDVSIREEFGMNKSSAQRTETLNRFFLRLKNPNAVKGAKHHFVGALDALAVGFDLGAQATGDRTLPITWGEARTSQLQSWRTMVIAARGALDDWRTIPFVKRDVNTNRNIEANFGIFFDAPFNAAEVVYEPFDYDDYWNEFSFVENFWRAAHERYFRPTDLYGFDSGDLSAWTENWYDLGWLDAVTSPLIDKVGEAGPTCKYPWE